MNYSNSDRSFNISLVLGTEYQKEKADRDCHLISLRPRWFALSNVICNGTSSEMHCWCTPIFALTPHANNQPLSYSFHMKWIPTWKNLSNIQISIGNDVLLIPMLVIFQIGSEVWRCRHLWTFSGLCWKGVKSHLMRPCMLHISHAILFICAGELLNSTSGRTLDL